MQGEVDQVVRKAIVGLRQVADDMRKQVEMRMEDTSVEVKGFLSEVLDQYADRINGYRAELGDAIGWAEPSADLLAARSLAAADLRSAAIFGHPAYAALFTIYGKSLFVGTQPNRSKTAPPICRST